MPNIKTLLFFIFLLMFSTVADAQKRRKSPVRKAPQAKVEIDSATILYDSMLGSTAQVMFVDSIVTDKSNFLNAVTISRSSGSLNTYDAFWKTTGQPSSFTYMNEFGNRALFSKREADGHSRLYAVDKLGGQWSEPKLINDFDDEFEDINCPYLMSDGITLYFSAKGKNSVGGYDIFVTMYDTDSARFYKPENIGLPYNSRANDYYYVIDEYNSIGWLVTDRNQPEDKVCVYSFIPSDSRKAYDEDEMGEERLRSLASINSISDTWIDQNALQTARERLATLKKQDSREIENKIFFYINDDVVYTSAADFRQPSNRLRYTKLSEMKAEIAELETSVDSLRQKYSTASHIEQRAMKSKILEGEHRLEQLYTDTKSLEKEMRNTENRVLTKQ